MNLLPVFGALERPLVRDVTAEPVGIFFQKLDPPVDCGCRGTMMSGRHDDEGAWRLRALGGAFPGQPEILIGRAGHFKLRMCTQPHLKRTQKVIRVGGPGIGVRGHLVALLAVGLSQGVFDLMGCVRPSSRLLDCLIGQGYDHSRRVSRLQRRIEARHQPLVLLLHLIVIVEKGLDTLFDQLLRLLQVAVCHGEAVI